MAGQGAADQLAPDDAPDVFAGLRGHVVVCNCNEKTRALVENLQRAVAPEGLDVVLLVQDDELWASHPEWHPRETGAGRFLTISGCPTEAQCLRQAKVAEARAAVILADPNQGDLADARSTLVAIAIERQNPHVETVMELLSSVHRVHLRATEVNQVVCLGDVTEKLIAQSCINPGVKNVYDDLLSVTRGRSSILTPPLPEGLAGRTYRQLARRAILAGAPFVLVGFIPSGEDGSQGDFVLNPAADEEPGRDTPLEAGARLVVVASRAPDLERYLAKQPQVT